MLKIFRYLKKSIFAIILIILLLVTQAICDLALPGYTAKIVDVGIQAGGISDACPSKIRKSQMDKVILVTGEEEKILENFTLEDEIYKLNKVDKTTLEELNEIFTKGFLMISSFENQKELSEKEKSKMIDAIPEAVEILEVVTFDMMAERLKNVSYEQRMEFLSKIYEEIEKTMPDMMLKQIAINFVKQEYEAIGVDSNKIQMDYIFFAGLQMIGLALARTAIGFCTIFLSSRVGATLGKDLRSKVFKKVVKFSNREFEEFSTASLITRTTNDIQQVQMFITMMFRMVVYAPILCIGGFIKVYSAGSSMEWILGLGILAIMTLVITLFIIAMPKFKIMQTLVDKINLVAREILTGLPVIRAFANQKYEEKRFDKANRDLTKTNVFVNRAMAFMMPTMIFIMNGITVLIVWVGSKNVDLGNIQVGNMMAFIQYTMQIIMAFLFISMVSIMMPRAAVSGKRITEVLETESSVKDPKNPKKFPDDMKGYLEFKDVSFRYHDAKEDVLSNVSFIAKPGETTAIIGSTGSGKSTLVNLIPRFFDITNGEILIDGINIKDVTQHDLRAKIGFVPQKGILFSGTIESNIKYGNIEISDDEMYKAANIAQATEFIDEKTDKYQDPIAQSRK